MSSELNMEPEPIPPPTSRAYSPIALAALGLALLAALVGVFAALGSRWGLWHYTGGFAAVRWAAWGGLLAILVAVGAMFHAKPGGERRGFAVAMGALVLGMLVAGIPWQNYRASAGSPPIHDVTTDPDDPPAFVAIAPLRADAPNPADYGGDDVARLQRSAYPDIRPVVLDLSPDRAYQRALDVVEARGWRLVDASAEDGRIEATDRTFWFGFREDIVIRITPLGNRAVLDVRSKSRVGEGDRGTNARRVRDYIADVMR